MLCIHPIKVKGRDGLVPCGQCCLCREQYAKQWAVRASVENIMHDKSVFLTLTYDDEHLPEDRSVHKRDLQLFLKRLRKICHKKIRYFSCGEYGETSGRPHYHLIIYGLNKNDPVFYNMRGSSGNCRAWPFGRSYVGDVTFQSCKYVAGYVAKKYKGKDALEHYKELGVEPEFCLSSRRPGIGGSYFEKYQNVVFNKGYITISGKKYDVPRYFEEKKKQLDWQYALQQKIDIAKRQFEEEQVNRAKFNKSAYSYYGDLGYSFARHCFDKEQAEQKEANFLARLKRKRKGALNV